VLGETISLVDLVFELLCARTAGAVTGGLPGNVGGLRYAGGFRYAGLLPMPGVVGEESITSDSVAPASVAADTLAEDASSVAGKTRALLDVDVASILPRLLTNNPGRRTLATFVLLKSLLWCVVILFVIRIPTNGETKTL